MAIYKSAQGKRVDMSALMAKNEQTRAVGVQPAGEGKKTTGLRVNARGDTIDAKGNVIKSMTQKRAEGYGATVGNKSAQASNKHPMPMVKSKPKADFDFEINQHKHLTNIQCLWLNQSQKRTLILQPKKKC